MWETRPWATAPTVEVYAKRVGLAGHRVRLTLDPRVYEAESDRALRREGEVMAVTLDGPTIIMADGEKIALIDVLLIERLPDGE